MKIKVLKQADQNRIRLLDFISNLHSPFIADEVDVAIEACIQNLATFPSKWQRYETAHYGETRRAIVNSNTIILYYIENDVITVVDIFDARTNWQ